MYNVSALSVRAGDAGRVCRGDASDASARFLQSAALLGEGGYLGLLISAGSGGEPSVTAYSSADSGVTADDYDWIFRGCAKTLPPPEEYGGLLAGRRRIYALAPGERRCDDEYDRGADADRFRETLDMLLTAGAAIRLEAGAGEAGGEGRGAVLFTLPEAMTLRLRTAAAFAFGAAPEEIASAENAPRQLPGGAFRHAMRGLLCALMLRAGDAMRESGDVTEDEDAEAEWGAVIDDFTPIEDLKLSVRAYNCLKRAGIHSVEELRAMSEGELRRVRSLGAKCVEEIRHKLAPAPAAPQAPPREVGGMDKLEGMVGLPGVKEQVRRIAAFARMTRDMQAAGQERPQMALNMEFIGNPGTAKTTVARVFAEIFYELGLLSDPEPYEVGRADLVAKYVGQTADRVRRVFENAKGRLLFIDEAYSLTDGRDDFGSEAVSTIVQEMENRRGDTVVIFAGYPDRMEEFFSQNPGLRSRVPFTLRFADYTADEMAEIADLEARKRGFALSDAAKSAVRAICGSAQDRPEAGNGRFCRNLVESAILSYAARLYGGGDAAPEAEPTLTEADFSCPPALRDAERTVRIGFHA